MAFAHSAQLLWTDCGYPRWSVFFTLPNAIFFYMLFNDFYKKSYGSKKAQPTPVTATDSASAVKSIENNNSPKVASKEL